MHLNTQTYVLVQKCTSADPKMLPESFLFLLKTVTPQASSSILIRLYPHLADRIISRLPHAWRKSSLTSSSSTVHNTGSVMLTLLGEGIPRCVMCSPPRLFLFSVVQKNKLMGGVRIVFEFHPPLIN